MTFRNVSAQTPLFIFHLPLNGTVHRAVQCRAAQRAVEKFKRRIHQGIALFFSHHGRDNGRASDNATAGVKRLINRAVLMQRK